MKRQQQLQGAIIVLAAVIAAASGSAALAQSAGSWSLKAGGSQLTPQVDSGNMSAPALPGTRIGLQRDTQAIIAAGYMLSDNLSAEFQLNSPYKHAVEGDGAIRGAGRLGTVESLLPTLFLQWRFLEPKALLRPYIGLGLSYVRFQKESGSGALTALTNTGSAVATRFSLDSRFALAPQAGLTYAINDQWFADLAVSKTYLKTTAHFSTGQKIDVRPDPLAVSVALGYRF